MNNREFQVGERVEILLPITMCWVDAAIRSKRIPFDGEYFCVWGGGGSERAVGWFASERVREKASAPRALTEAAHAVVRERNEAVARADAAEKACDRVVKHLNEMTASRDNECKLHATTIAAYDRARQERDIARAALPPLETSLKLHEATVAALSSQIEDAKVENQRVWNEAQKLRERIELQLKDSKDRPLHVTDVTIDQQTAYHPDGVCSRLRLRGTRALRAGAAPFTVWDAMRGREDAEVHLQFDEHLINLLRRVLSCVAEPTPSNASEFVNVIDKAREQLGATATEGLLDVIKRLRHFIGARGPSETTIAAAKRVVDEANAARSAKCELDAAAEAIAACKAALK